MRRSPQMTLSHVHIDPMLSVCLHICLSMSLPLSSSLHHYTNFSLNRALCGVSTAVLSHYSFSHLENLYSAPSRNLLKGAPCSPTSSEQLIEQRRVTLCQQLNLQRNEFHNRKKQLRMHGAAWSSSTYTLGTQSSSRLRMRIILPYLHFFNGKPVQS